MPRCHTPQPAHPVILVLSSFIALFFCAVLLLYSCARLLCLCDTINTNVLYYLNMIGVYLGSNVLLSILFYHRLYNTTVLLLYYYYCAAIYNVMLLNYHNNNVLLS